jgi:small membrane protein
MIIKVLLIVGLCSVGVYASRNPTGAAHLAVRRIVGGAVLLLGAVSVLSPILVTHVANLVGVKRGTDLLLYLFVVVSLLIWVSIYRRLDDMERRFATLVRQLALTESRVDIHRQDTRSD